MGSAHLRQATAERLAGATVVVIAVVAITKVVAADEPRRGFFLDAAAGAGLSLGSHISEVLSDDPSLGAFPMDLGEDIGGPMVHLSVTPAYEWSGLAAGVGFDAAYVDAVVEDYGASGATLLSISAVGMARSRETGVMAALGLGLGLALLPELTYGTPHLHAAAQTLVGPRVGGRIGYSFASGIGIATSASYAWLSHEDARYKPLTLTVDVTFSGE